MDVHQVNSRGLHDEEEATEVAYAHGPDADADAGAGPGTEEIGPAAGPGGDADGGDLEKRQTMASATSAAEETYPEGGLRAWLVVLGSWFCMFSSLGLMNSIAVFQAYTLGHQLRGYSEGTVGWVFSIYTFLAFFCGVYIGPVFDKYGPRWLVVAGCLCTVVGVVSMSFCHELYQFILSFGILAGLGTSLLFTPSVASVGHWFKARRGFATGMASTAGGLGGVIFPLMLTPLFSDIGYGWATRVLALICLACSIAGACLVRARLPPAQNATAHPDFRIFRQVPFLLATIGIFLLEFSLFIPLTYISSYALRAGFSQQFGYHLLPILNAASVVGRALPGYYADVVGPFNTCMLSVLLQAVGCLCVWLPLGDTAPGIIVFAVMFGFGSGTCISIAPVCIGRMCKTQEYGRYYATTYTVVSFACLIGIPIAGSIVQANSGEYYGLIIFTGVIYLASVVVLMLAKTWTLGWKGWRAAY